MEKLSNEQQETIIKGEEQIIKRSVRKNPGTIRIEKQTGVNPVIKLINKICYYIKEFSCILGIKNPMLCSYSVEDEPIGLVLCEYAVIE